MYLPATTASSGDFTPPPTGLAAAVCTGFIDLGSSMSNFGKMQRKARLVFELLDEMRDDGTPHVISRRYTFSMSDKANLRNDLEAWRGRPFGPGEAEAFNVRNLIGVVCTLNIVCKPGQDGKDITFCDGVMAKMKNYPARATPKSEIVYFAMTKEFFSAADFAKLRQKTQDEIKLSPEYAEMTGGRPQPQRPTASAQQPRNANQTSDPRDAADGFGHNNGGGSMPKTAATKPMNKIIEDEIPFGPECR